MGSPSITFITGQLGLGGAERQLYLLVRELQQRAWRVSIITLNPGCGDYWEKPIEDIGITLFGVRPDQPRIRRVLAIKRILGEQRPTIAHSWTIYANIYASLSGRLSSVPVRIGSERANNKSSRRDIGDWWYAASTRGLDALVTNSKAESEYLHRYRPDLLVHTVPNGVEIPIEVCPSANLQLRDRLGIPRSAFVIGAVGSMYPRKNFGLLIRAAQVLGEKMPEAYVAFIGDGPLRKELEQTADEGCLKGRTLFTGRLPEARNWFPAFDLLCMPALNQEGMPNVLMEAAAAGLPVVASSVGGAPEVVADGITGSLVPPGDVGALTGSLERLARDPQLRVQMGRAGREKMKQEFSVEQMVARMSAAYDETLLAKGVPCR